MANERIGVVFGGRTTEHEVSVVTAIQIMRLLSKNHPIIPLYITKEGCWYTGKKLTDLDFFKHFDPKDPGVEPVVLTGDVSLPVLANPLPKGLMAKPHKLEIDVLFPAMHGMNGEDGTIQGLFEMANLPYVGSGVLASAICIDKVMTKVVLAGSDLPILDYLWFSRAEWEKDEDLVVTRIQEKIGLPVIVKPARLGSSIGIAVARTADDLKFDISVATHFDSKIIIEPYLENRTDLNVSVLGNYDLQPSLVEQPLSKDQLLTFEEKYLAASRDRGMEGAKRIIPAPISESMTQKLQNMAMDVFRSVDARGIARIDFLLNQSTGQVYVNEINTLPGSFAYYLWEPLGITPEALMNRLIDLALEEFREKGKTNFTSGNQLLLNTGFLGLKK
jgi:D-alanine-D-alanine ligase